MILNTVFQWSWRERCCRLGRAVGVFANTILVELKADAWFYTVEPRTPHHYRDKREAAAVTATLVYGVRFLGHDTYSA